MRKKVFPLLGLICFALFIGNVSALEPGGFEITETANTLSLSSVYNYYSGVQASWVTRHGWSAGVRANIVIHYYKTSGDNEFVAHWLEIVHRFGYLTHVVDEFFQVGATYDKVHGFKLYVEYYLNNGAQYQLLFLDAAQTLTPYEMKIVWDFGTKEWVASIDGIEEYRLKFNTWFPGEPGDNYYWYVSKAESTSMYNAIKSESGNLAEYYSSDGATYNWVSWEAWTTAVDSPLIFRVLKYPSAFGVGTKGVTRTRGVWCNRFGPRLL